MTLTEQLTESIAKGSTLTIVITVAASLAPSVLFSPSWF